MPSDANSLDLPADLLEFLSAGRQLDYDAEGSELGRIILKGIAELERSTIQTPPGCTSIIDDPYFGLSGSYLVDVVDLVADSDSYRVEGLLCWIIALRCFGCIDPEHGDVIRFDGVSWTELAADPLAYLELQWGNDDATIRALPWLHFPFRSDDADFVIEPYGQVCPLHQTAVIEQRTCKPALLEIFQRRMLQEWLREYLATFPRSGVPATEKELLCCAACRAAEDAWLQSMDESMEVIDVKPNVHGWIQCPGCGVRFSTEDPNRFRDGRHWTCGQKVRLAV